METLCPSVQSSGEAVRDQLTLGGILLAFLPLLLHLLNLGTHKLRVLWQLAACGTPALGANLFHCPHCQHRHWAPRSCGNRHCPRCLAAKSWQWLEKQTRSLLPITYYHCVFSLIFSVSSLNRCLGHHGIPIHNLTREEVDVRYIRSLFFRLFPLKLLTQLW